MWGSLVAITVAAAIGCCIAATMMQPKSDIMRPKPDRALMTAALEALPIRIRDTGKAAASQVVFRMQDTGKAAARQAVRASIGKHLRELYGDVANEPIPAHLMMLVRRLENLAPPIAS